MKERVKTAAAAHRKTGRGDKAGNGGLQTAGAALNVFGALPLETHALYYVGTLPFVVAFLYFWFDMSQSACAGERLVLWALILPLLFVWMKCWHSVYVNAVWQRISRIDPVRYTWAGVLRLMLFNAIIQPLGLIVMPVALLFGIPFSAAGFFFQDALLSREVYAEGVLARCADSLRCARANPAQGFLLMWLFSPWQMGAAVLMIGFITFINRYLALHQADDHSVSLMLVSLTAQIALTACVLSPFASLLAGGIVLSVSGAWWALEHLLGIEVPLAYGVGSMLLSTSFVAVVYFLVFMLLDPLIKIAAVLRRFAFDSRSGGGDILLALRELAQRGGRTAVLPLVIACALPWLAVTARAQPPESAGVVPVRESVGAAGYREGRVRLDTALDETLRKPRYTWRVPKPVTLDKRGEQMPGWYRQLTELLKNRADRVKAILDRSGAWLRRLLSGRGHGRVGGFPLFGMGFTEATFYLLLAAFTVTATILFLRWMRSRRRLLRAAVAADAPLRVDIHDQSVGPDDLPPDEWGELALALVASGDYRAAVRALFLGALAQLGEAGLITLRAYKSNRDYRRELELRVRDRYDLLDLFRGLTRLMECTWYGFVPVDEPMWRECQTQSLELRRACAPEPAAAHSAAGGPQW